MACFSRTDRQHDVQALIVKPLFLPAPDHRDAPNAPQALPHVAPCRQRRLLAARADGEHRAWEGFDDSGFRLLQGNTAAKTEPVTRVRLAVQHSGRKSSYSTSSLTTIKTAVDKKITVQRPVEVLATRSWAGPRQNGKAHTVHTSDVWRRATPCRRSRSGVQQVKLNEFRYRRQS